MPQETLRTTSAGGLPPFAPQTSSEPSQDPTRSSTHRPSQTQALVSALLSPLATDGAPGDYSLDGTQTALRSGGQKPLDLSSLFNPSWQLLPQGTNSRSMETTGASLKAGGKEEAGIDTRTSFSAESTPSRIMSNALFTLATSQAKKTLPMDHREASTPLDSSSSQIPPSHVKPHTFLPTSTPHFHQLSTVLATALLQPQHIQNHPETAAMHPNTGPPQASTSAQTNPRPERRNMGNQHNARTNTLPPLLGTGLPARYNPNLTPIPSPLRPHCLARDRLRLWRPIRSRLPQDQQGLPVNLVDTDLERILDVMSQAWEKGTRETYGSGLLTFHVFCDSKQIPEAQRAPVSHILLSGFISMLAGAYQEHTPEKP